MRVNIEKISNIHTHYIHTLILDIDFIFFLKFTDLSIFKLPESGLYIFQSSSDSPLGLLTETLGNFYISSKDCKAKEKQHKLMNPRFIVQFSKSLCETLYTAFWPGCKMKS